MKIIKFIIILKVVKLYSNVVMKVHWELEFNGQELVEIVNYHLVLVMLTVVLKFQILR